MAIAYDEPKRALNLQRHGFDFADFAEHFDASTAAFSETATGRERFRVVGLWSDGRIVTAIVSPLGSEAWSLVSLQPRATRRGAPMPSTTHRNEIPPSTASEDLDDVMTPEMDDEEAARAKPIHEAPASLLAALPRNRGGRPRSASPKAHVSLRVDADVLAAYKATGEGWQVRMNEALKRGVAGLERA